MIKEVAARRFWRRKAIIITINEAGRIGRAWESGSLLEGVSDLDRVLRNLIRHSSVNDIAILTQKWPLVTS